MGVHAIKQDPLTVTLVGIIATLYVFFNLFNTALGKTENAVYVDLNLEKKLGEV